MSAKRLEALARDILGCFRCHCNDDCRPEDCECGGDGTGGLTGCWACQAYTAINGFGKAPPDDEPAPAPPGGRGETR